MTEAEWRTTSDVDAMLGVLALSPIPPKRFRVFGVACVYRIRPLLGPEVAAALDEIAADPGRPGEAVPAGWRVCGRERAEVAARIDWQRGATDARDLAQWVVREQAVLAMIRALMGTDHPAAQASALCASRAAGLAERLAHRYPSDGPVPQSEVDRFLPPISAAERAAQADLLRCIFGNPFRPVAFDPAWRTEAVVGLARGMDDAHDFAALPVLADALEDAGCADAGLLAHARGPGPHARGCHVIDHVLGRW